MLDLLSRRPRWTAACGSDPGLELLYPDRASIVGGDSSARRRAPARPGRAVGGGV